MPKYKLTFYRTTHEYADKIVEADTFEQAADIAAITLNETGGLDWNMGENESEFDVDEVTSGESDGT